MCGLSCIQLKQHETENLKTIIIVDNYPAILTNKQEKNVEFLDD